METIVCHIKSFLTFDLFKSNDWLDKINYQYLSNLRLKLNSDYRYGYTILFMNTITYICKGVDVKRVQKYHPTCYETINLQTNE
jgi:ABC-type microcin C transport system permease subunit YejB